MNQRRTRAPGGGTSLATRRSSHSAASRASGGFESDLRSRLLFLQRTAGNRAVAAFVSGSAGSIELPVQRAFEDGGRSGDATQGEPIREESEAATPAPTKVNEWGDIDGSMVSGVHPHLFRNNGMTGRAPDNLIGGRGSTGDQDVGSFQSVAPAYDTRPARSGFFGIGKRPAAAWIRAGTGTVTVVRSYTGTRQGDNSPYYFTARAVARSDRHEELHIASTRSIHNTQVGPLEARVAAKTGTANATTGASEAAARTALQAALAWNPTLVAFSADDTAANTPGGTTDTIDAARPDFVADYGPRAVAGVNYGHYIDVPPGP